MIPKSELYGLLVLIRLVVTDLAVVTLSETPIHLRSHQEKIRLVPTIRHLLVQIFDIIGEHRACSRYRNGCIGLPESIDRLRAIDSSDDVIGGCDPGHQIVNVDRRILRSLVEQSSRELHE